MESDLHPASAIVDAGGGVSWAAVAAGAVAAAALTLFLSLLALGLACQPYRLGAIPAFHPRHSEPEPEFIW
jgi:hypothetical protein